jgi:hypothetical protein
MNKEKLNQLFYQINKIAEELELTQVAYKRLGEDRGTNLKLVLGDYWTLPVANQSSAVNRGIDMIVLGLQKHLTAKAESLKEKIKRLQAEVNKEIEGAA